MPRGRARARGLLRALIDMLRIAFPKARFLVRLNGGLPRRSCSTFSTLSLDEDVAMAEKAVLARAAEPAMVEA